VIESRILTIRGNHVLLDADFADAYGVSTKALNQAIRRNPDRFPADFCFQLTRMEREEVVTNCDHLGHLKFAPTLPWAFTEHGSLMAASILRSRHAVQMSIFVIRTFVRLREHVAANAAILERLAEIDQALLQHDAALRDVYRKLQPLLTPPPDAPKRRIGF